MSSEAVPIAIEVAYNMLSKKNYLPTVLTDLTKATFNNPATGTCIRIQSGNSGVAEVDIEITPMTDRLLHLTTYKCAGRTDDIIYAVDHARGVNKRVRCFLHPNRKMSVPIAPHQAEDTALIVRYIMHAM